MVRVGNTMKVIFVCNWTTFFLSFFSLSLLPLYAEKANDTKFSHDRGFYDSNFNLTISSSTPGAKIKYTLDGSNPLTSSKAITADSPVTFNVNPDSDYGGKRPRKVPSVLVRAYALKSGIDPSNIDTHSYIFLDKVITQGDHRPGGSYVFWSTVMDPEVTNATAYKSKMKPALKDIPSMSIIMDWEDLFGTKGVHRGNNLAKTDYEKPCSIELIYPSSTKFQNFKGFQEDAGLRIQGGGGRWNNGTYDHKQSFTVKFRKSYGAGTLEYPVFESSYAKASKKYHTANKYDRLVLRAGHNKSWGIDYDRGKTVYTRDQFGRDLQIAMSGDGSRGTFVHLYLNGLYWGLYNPCERPDHKNHAAYNGGDGDQYFAKKRKQSTPINSIGKSRWDAIYNTHSKSSNINTVLKHIDIINQIDMSLLTGYADTGDSPQYYWGFNNTPEGPLRYFQWDMEDAFGGGSKRTSKNPNWSQLSGTATNFDTSLIGKLWGGTVDYRITWADRVYRHCYNGGELQTSVIQKRWDDICVQIYEAIIGESARWGDERGSLMKRDNQWANARNLVRADLKDREIRLVNLLKGKNRYPGTAPPSVKVGGNSLNTISKTISKGTKVDLIVTGSGVKLYYTTNLKDPRAIGGTIIGTDGGTTTQLTVNESMTILVRAKSNASDNFNGWSPLRRIELTVPNSSGDLSKLKVTEIMYNPASNSAGTIDGDEFEFIELKNTGSKKINLSGLKIEGIGYTFPVGVTLNAGNLIVLASNNEAFFTRYGFKAFDRYRSHLDNGGEKLKLLSPTGTLIQEISYND